MNARLGHEADLVREREPKMKVGDRVRVTKSVVVYHYPKSKNQPLDLKGMEGEIIDIVTNWQGRPVSANLPIVVKFEKNFKAHFREDEVEVI
nr:ferredoxin-thioredoxin reductase variable chain [Hydrococcus rivularis]